MIISCKYQTNLGTQICLETDLKVNEPINGELLNLAKNIPVVEPNRFYIHYIIPLFRVHQRLIQSEFSHVFDVYSEQIEIV